VKSYDGSILASRNDKLLSYSRNKIENSRTEVSSYEVFLMRQKKGAYLPFQWTPFEGNLGSIKFHDLVYSSRRPFNKFMARKKSWMRKAET